MIDIINLSKKFGSFCAIKNLNLKIETGQIYCLLGPNGAGKTTTLKILTGLMKPTVGKVTINGLDVFSEHHKVKKILGFIPDTPFLYENLTPVEFLKFVGDVFGVERKVIEDKTKYYFDIFNLVDYQNILIKELSHGMRQKVVYSANFIHSPLVYFIDEPLVGLDPYSIHIIKKLLKDEADKGKTILICTHILSLAEELGGRIGILHDGTLIAQGEAASLKKELSAQSLEEVFLRLTRRLPR